jgi:hypothetical protein
MPVAVTLTAVVMPVAGLFRAQRFEASFQESCHRFFRVLLQGHEHLDSRLF